MLSRLVLGCGGFGTAVIEAADASGEFRVLDPGATRVETLRNESVAADQADVTDPDAISEASDPDVVFVAGDDPEQNAGAAAAAREAFPGAHLIAYLGEDATRAVRERTAAVADRTLDPGVAVLDWLAGHVEDAQYERARGLRAALSGVERLGVVTHDNPDPDAIAAATALAAVVETLGVEAEVCYFGDISHQENRALVNLLELDLRNVEPGEDLGYDGIALVDHSQPGENSQLPEDTPVDVVVDHHPTEAVTATFVDCRPEVGATSTLLVDYLDWFGVDLSAALATALLYGIRVDTREFTRDAAPLDFEAAADLLPRADETVLEQVESPSVSGDTFDTIARAVRRRETRGSTLVSVVGEIADRHALAQAADRLLTIEGVTTTLVCGFTDGTAYVSARQRGGDIDLGRALRKAFGDIGSAGGHADMAGAQLPLGVFDAVETDGDLAGILADAVADRFFGAVGEGEPAPAADRRG
jgi:nanoRNase/pAp phosphatase (c-di-AMP/oligoRNAs hydrolase)